MGSPGVPWRGAFSFSVLAAPALGKLKAMAVNTPALIKDKRKTFMFI
jgi:hypothetical protein